MDTQAIERRGGNDADDAIPDVKRAALLANKGFPVTLHRDPVSQPTKTLLVKIDPKNLRGSFKEFNGELDDQAILAGFQQSGFQPLPGGTSPLDIRDIRSGDPGALVAFQMTDAHRFIGSAAGIPALGICGGDVDATDWLSRPAWVLDPLSGTPDLKTAKTTMRWLGTAQYVLGALVVEGNMSTGIFIDPKIENLGN